MYLRILKKDIKRKKTMNVILLIFIILAATFIASSVNNMVTVVTALDSYFEKAEVPDYWFATADEQEMEKFNTFAKENGYAFRSVRLIQINQKDITVSGEKFNYSNTICVSTVNGSKIFDSDSNEITQVNDGEVYVTAGIFSSNKNDFYEGGKIVIKTESGEKEFTIKGCMKDALFGSSMIGMTRFLISENDYKLFDGEQVSAMESVGIYTNDAGFSEKFNDLDLNIIFNADYEMVKMMYMMDMLIAAVMLVVSVCLILISMVILHFTIHFTMSEEFREIGVMKAIGISNRRIRGLYIVKYFGISVIGAAIGLALSVPFGTLLLGNVSKNIILTGKGMFILNVFCAGLTAAVVVLFCYFCTRKIKKFSPVDAIRNGETGERYSRKGFIHLGRSGLAPVPFMAVNDILSGLKRYISMLVIFTLGILLIIIPVNTINTLQSDRLINWFNMAKSDLVISQELLFSPNGSNEEQINNNLNGIRKTLRNNQIEADVFQEIMFRMNISKGDKKMSSLAFLGTGGVTADEYIYIEGTAPRSRKEVAISYIVADKIGAHIGDDVAINTGSETKTYTVTGINQTMNNMGEGIRFFQGEKLDFSYAAGCFGIQIRYTDNPDIKTFAHRKELLEKLYPDSDIYTAGEYISYMIGDAASQLQDMRSIILAIVLCINMLVAVLMVKSFITKEKSEIAILKAIGFQNSSLTIWQTMRIGLVLLISVIIGTLLSLPLSKLIVQPIFRMMGAYSIEFDVVPVEVYVIYPLLVLAVTVLAAFVSAQGLRNIPASEASNIE